MADPMPAKRRSALDNRLAARPGVTVAPAAPARRISLRAPADSQAALSRALGIRLPAKPKSSTTKDGRSALWLGPDEWLVIDESGADPAAGLSRVKALHSAVDISHRNVAILVSGPSWEPTIAAGCPQELSDAAFPIGAASRTVFGKVEIVLWRTGEETFRIECWRSFSDYVFGLLSDAARDALA